MTSRIRPEHWRRPPATDSDVHGLGVIDHDACLRLLRQERVGRLGLSIGSLPVILPVNYALDVETIVFRSELGDKVRAAGLGAVACLQIDHIDRFEHRGWSVIATGRLAIVTGERADRYRSLPVLPWALSGPSVFIEMPIELLSGRSISK